MQCVHFQCNTQPSKFMKVTIKFSSNYIRTINCCVNNRAGANVSIEDGR